MFHYLAQNKVMFRYSFFALFINFFVDVVCYPTKSPSKLIVS